MKTEPTGRRITEEEHFLVVQLWGEYGKYHDEPRKTKVNTVLSLLGTKYGYDWTKHIIKLDTGDVLKVCDNCDAELKPEDVRIEE